MPNSTEKSRTFLLYHQQEVINGFLRHRGMHYAGPNDKLVTKKKSSPSSDFNMPRAKTNAQCQQTYINRIKQDAPKYAQFKVTKALQSQVSRKKRKDRMTEEEAESHRVYERERKRRQRLQKANPLVVKISSSTGTSHIA